MQQKQTSPARKVAVIGGYLPRQCGIATFTTDLCEALSADYPESTVFALPVNDTKEGYDYPERVRFELEQDDIDSYRHAADFLNLTNVDVVYLQHEYGIFGGKAGSHILTLLRKLRMPIITTLHTVLKDPDEDQRLVMENLIELSDRLVVMSEHGLTFLQDIYRVPMEKIELIPHGIPDVSFVDPNFYKDEFDAEGKMVLLTFGLLSPNKGIEDVIKALPAIVERFPDVVYMVLGTTHPHVKRRDGEHYREGLQELAHTLGVEDHVIFYNEFVSTEQLIKYMGVADIYIIPYHNEAQITSGTLAYTVGAGKAVISTPYWHAQELLADGRGVLVPFRDADAIANEVIELLDNDVERHAMRKRAYIYGREMIWSRVAEHYMELYLAVREERMRMPHSSSGIRFLEDPTRQAPRPNLEHLRRMTDDTGMLQHAVFGVPNYTEGYSTDDNARALIAAVYLDELGGSLAKEAQDLAIRYLAFLWYAHNPQTNRFRNFLSYSREWMEEVGSEDSHGRAIWSLGTVLGRSREQSLLGMAGQMFERTLQSTLSFESPRAWAFTLIGVHEYLRRFAGDRVAHHVREELAERLMTCYTNYSHPDWPWFENVLAYDNATLARALLLSGAGMERDDMVATALTALEWLSELQRPGDEHFVPIGCNGFYSRGSERARFDQQPVEAYSMVSTCLDAYRITGEERWRKDAQMAYEWFMGRNDLQVSLYDASTGGCFDGLQPDGVNRNQGAESTLACLLSVLELRLSESMVHGISIVETTPAMPLLPVTRRVIPMLESGTMPDDLASDSIPAE